MPQKLLNLCLDATFGPLSMTLRPHGGGSGSYCFQVFSVRGEPLHTHVGSRITMDRSGPYRIVAWDGSPPVPSESLFAEPTWLDPEMEFTLEGTANVVSASARNPWPPMER
jgi:hypothetical protein